MPTTFTVTLTDDQVGLAQVDITTNRTPGYTVQQWVASIITSRLRFTAQKLPAIKLPPSMSTAKDSMEATLIVDVK